MKLGELIINLSVKGDAKKLDDAIKKLELSVKKSKLLLQYRKDLANATTKEQKDLIKRNFADNIRLLNLKEQKNAIQGNATAMAGMVKTATAITTAIIGAVIALDRMADSMAKVNQAMVNFQSQTGISFGTLNKYASASAAVNYNATAEGMAQTMQRLRQNLYKIQRGQGDFSPYLQLQYEAGGKPVDVQGKSVVEVIEQVREAIKGIKDDAVATDIITRMGFSPDDLLMLRMTREEFDKISSSYFLSDEQRKDMYKFSLELKQIHMQLQYIYQRVILALMRAALPQLKDFFSALSNIGKAIDNINKAFDKSFLSNEKFADLRNNLSQAGEMIKLALNPLLMLFYVIEDIAVYFLGGKSALGFAIDGFKLWAENLKESFNSLIGIGENFSLSNIIDQFKKFGEIVLTLIPGIGTIVQGIKLIQQYEQGKLSANSLSDNIAPTIANNTTTTTNNAVNNTVTVNTSQPVSEVIADVTYSSAGVQLQSSYT